MYMLSNAKMFLYLSSGLTHAKDELSWSLTFTFMSDKGKALKSHYTPKFLNRPPPKSINIRHMK